MTVCLYADDRGTSFLDRTVHGYIKCQRNLVFVDHLVLMDWVGAYLVFAVLS